MAGGGRTGILLVDVSNTFTKIAVARRGVIGRVRKVPTAKLSPADFQVRAGLAVISSVVPSAGALLASSLPCPPLWVDHRVPGGIAVDYPSPSTIGADRLANSVAAASLGRLPAVVVDFGTAVTFDVIDERGCYVGGIIAPGLPTAAAALHERTALLPLARITTVSTAVGRSTSEAIRIGLLLGAVGLVREAVSRIAKERFRSKKPHILATGGDAEMVHRLCGREKVIDLVDPLLTLRGLLVIGERNL
jgi:type III pantothenate kinase